MTQKTATGLVTYAKAQIGKPYWYGTFGNKPTSELLEQKSKQYPHPKFSSYRPDRMPMFRAQIGKFDRVHDCVGLLKGYLWSETPASPPKYNAAQDVSADGMRGKSDAKPIASIPETPGALVFLPGHVGVYIGGGQVIEARGSDYGVVQTALKSRPWTHWGRCPWIDYQNTAAPEQPKGTQLEHVVRQGDTLWALAAKYLGSGTRWEEIRTLNCIADERKLPIGMALKIPGK